MGEPSTVLCYEAFTTQVGMGNPSGVVLDSQGLCDADMQSIAAQAGYAETVFVLPSSKADLRLRYFTPGHEMNLCGHGTIAVFHAMHERALLPASAEVPIQTETLAGVLPIAVETSGAEVVVRMRQCAPQLVACEGDPTPVCHAIGIQPSDLHDSLPLVYGSTGIWTLVVPVSGLEAMGRMAPDNTAFPAAMPQMPRVSIHPFCLDTLDSRAHLHARHFSSPYSGTVEDAATGTASGVLGAYHDAYIDTAADGPRVRELCVEQGIEMGRDARIHVRLTGAGPATVVEVAGSACFAGERLLTPQTC